MNERNEVADIDPLVTNPGLAGGVTGGMLRTWLASVKNETSDLYCRHGDHLFQINTAEIDSDGDILLSRDPLRGEPNRCAHKANTPTGIGTCNGPVDRQGKCDRQSDHIR
jgi:hypothetical protein